MPGCHGCQELMLEYLYDALEEADQLTFRDHLQGCPACQAALDKARAQQALLAKAARLAFPTVTFTPPADEPVVLPLQAKRRFSPYWTRWALAAGVLLALTGLSVPGYRAYHDYNTAEKTVVAHHDAYAQARDQLDVAHKDVTNASQNLAKQLQDYDQTIKARELRLVVSGPQVLQSGTNSEFHVRAFDLTGRPAEADVVAQLTDDAPRGPGVLMLKNRTPANLVVTPTGEAGVYRVRIPPTVRLQPGQSLGMLVSATKKGGSGQPVRLQGQVKLSSSVSITHLTTDKPMYQPGEIVRFRSLTLDRGTHAPVDEDLHLHYVLKTPLGATRTLLRAAPSADKNLRGVGAGEFLLEADTPGGEYTLSVSEERNRFAPVTRKFLVNRYQKPRLDKKLDFNRSSYGPGDEVHAKVSAHRADAGPVANCKVDVTLSLDDKLYSSDGVATGVAFEETTEPDGSLIVRFKLPREIERGQATIAVKFKDQAVVETIVRPIPLVLNKIDVEFFPEGGDLVAGLPNRVYFQARTPLGKPAQLRGLLFEDGKSLPGIIVETLSDEDKPGVNQGQGVFRFTPKAKSVYTLQIDSPTGIATRKALPEPVEDRVVLHVPKGVFHPGEPIHVHVHSARPRALVVGGYCRGQLVDVVELPPGKTEAILRPRAGAGGVCRITVFEEQPIADKTQRALVPVAERLAYRHPKERLDVAINPDRQQYVPGQKASLTLSTTSESQALTPALALVAVVDKSVVVMADEKTHRTMPTHFLLTTEVRRAEDLEYADFLVGDHPKAPVALDLLLGTQGWRRFAEQDPQRFRDRLNKQGQAEEAERLLVMSGQGAPVETNFDQEQRLAIINNHAREMEALRARHSEAVAALRSHTKTDEYHAAVATVEQYRQALENLRAVAIPCLTTTLVLLLLAGLITALANRPARGLAFVGVAGACGVLLVVVLGGRSGGVPTVDPGPEQSVAMQFPELPNADLPQMERGKAREPDGGKSALPQPERGMNKAGKGGADNKGRPAPVPRTAPKPGGEGIGIASVPKKPGDVPQPGEGKDGKREEDKKEALLPLDEGKLRRDLQDREDGFYRRMADANRLRAAGGLARGEEGKREAEAMGARGLRKQDPRVPIVVREYAHVRTTSDAPGLRGDFTETLYWHPVLMLPAGQGKLSFELCDSVTSFEVTVFAHTHDGRLGAVTRTIDSRLPFSLAAKLPIEVTAGDRIDVPVAVSNNTPEKRTVDLRLKSAEGFDVLSPERTATLEVGPSGRARHLLSLRPNVRAGLGKLILEGVSGSLTDGIREQVRVVPDGFPVSGASSDLLEKSASHKITLPQWLPGTLEVRVDAYPSTLADLQKGLEGLLREPNGCFEQSSTANYPNVLILDYLKSNDQPEPALEKKSRDLLERGYKKLTSFECQESGTTRRQGYEWFGGTAPPHEALTAYGLLQFRDMAKVHEVDRAMLERTKAYLLGQRDGKGGFNRNPRALDTFGRAPDHVTNAYVVWALTECGVDDLATELEALVKQAKTSDDGYFLSLVSLSLANRDRKGEAIDLLRKIAALQKEGGQIEGAKTSITGSGGRDLVIETTALALLAWLKTDAVAFDAPIRKAIHWVGQQRSGHGSFGSTQATILALKALIAWTKDHKRSTNDGVLRLYVGEEKMAELPFLGGVEKPLTITLADAEKRLRVGENRLRVEVTGEQNVFPHTLSWACRTATPASAREQKVKLDAKLAKTTLAEGDTTRLTVKVTNVSGEHQGMAIAIVGLPAGISVPEDLKQLREYCLVPTEGGRPRVAAFEIQGRELVLYWRDLAKDQTIEVPIDVVARVPGEYRGPASRAYLYYNADHKHWVEPLTATIVAK